MAANKTYLLPFKVGLLGFSFFLSLFETSTAKQNFHKKSIDDRQYDSTVVNSFEEDISSSLRDLEKKELISLSLKIFADKQYDYDQNIYLAEGNVKVLVNGGILKSDLLNYNKSTGILSAEGNVSFRKGGQYFRAKEFKFNFLKKEGIIKDTYGLIDIRNVITDLRIDTNLNGIEAQNTINKKEPSIYNDGLEFAFGNIKLSDNKVTRSNKSIGSINNWRFKSNLIKIEESGWKSNRVIFTNDPFDPHQISFEAIDIIAEEEKDGELIITSSKTNLILENRTKISLGKRIFGEKKRKRSKFQFILDGKDRDGLVLVKRNNIKNINKNIELDFQPQFLIGRAILGKTYSYKHSQDKNINFSDLVGLNIRLKASDENWSFESLNDLSTFNTSRFFSGLRHSNTFSRYFRMPILEDSSFNIFTTYRNRAWNGTIGETEIKSAFGGFLEKTNSFVTGDVKNNFNIRIGTAKYEAEKFENSDIISLWRSSIFVSLNSEYTLFDTNLKNVYQKHLTPLSPVQVKPELVLKTNVNLGYYNYESASPQGLLKLSLGPEIRFGNLEKNFLDYTKFSVMPGVKIKFGNSPYKFDNAIDLKTLNISLMQQVYGPFMVDFISNLNIDNSSKNYGEYYDTKLGLVWHKRAYEWGVYYHPNNNAGGLYFRLNGFKFGNSVNELF